jgi:hypothetical protein
MNNYLKGLVIRDYGTFKASFNCKIAPVVNRPEVLKHADSPSSSDIPAVRCTVCETRVAAPLDAVVGWKLAAPLCLVELERQTQHLSVVVAACEAARKCSKTVRQPADQRCLVSPCGWLLVLLLLLCHSRASVLVAVCVSVAPTQPVACACHAVQVCACSTAFLTVFVLVCSSTRYRGRLPKCIFAVRTTQGPQYWSSVLQHDS